MRNLAALLFGVSVAANAQSQQHKESRILILLDGSASMQQEWNRQDSRFKAAAGIITRLIDSVYALNNTVEFGLRVYGHQHPAQDNNCYDTKQEVMFSRDNLTQMSLRLESLRPAGVSPIAFSLKQAAENDFTHTERYNYSLVLVTDGAESCKGDICAVAKELLEKKIAFKPYIISLLDHPSLKEQYTCLGEYLLTTEETDIPATIGTIIKEYRSIIPAKAARPKTIKVIDEIPDKKAASLPKYAVETVMPGANNTIPVKINAPVIAPVRVPVYTAEEDSLKGEGFIYFVNTSPMNDVYLFRMAKGAYVYDRTIKISGKKPQQKFKVKAGHYKVVYNIPEKKPAENFKLFKVLNEMITDVRLD